MPIKITKHAQSCILIESEESRILIDPGSYAVELENLKASDIGPVDLLIVTHKHGDHFSEEIVNEIIKRDNPKIITTKEVQEKIKENFFDAEFLSNLRDYGFNDLTLTTSISKHGPLPNGKPEPEVIGVKIEINDYSFYTPGDSLTLDQNADVIFTPICGVVVTNIEEAKEQLIKLNPKIAIPIHYDTPNYPVDVNDFPKAMEGTDIDFKVLKNGESIEL